jgi:inositol-phosphate phosphatase/L-galactose 1-phosphate phosphatase/histidinol-phosphatase
MSNISRLNLSDTSPDSEAYLAFIHEVSDQAREVAVRYFNAQPTIEQKADLSPVTQADRDIEAMIVAAIRTHFPVHGIVGEESGEWAPLATAKASDAYTWIVDPIDGTGSFTVGSPLFGTLVGLLRNGVPWIGSIDMSMLGQRFVGSAAGAFCNGEAIATGRCASVASAKLCTTSPEIFDSQEKRAFDQVAAVARLRRYGGDCYNYALLAAGRVDLVIEAGLKPYDYLPLVPLIEAAGGVVTDWEGHALGLHSSGRVVAAANVELHGEALHLLNQSM